MGGKSVLIQCLNTTYYATETRHVILQKNSTTLSKREQVPKINKSEYVEYI